jgi:hypothetical protein
MPQQNAQFVPSGEKQSAPDCNKVRSICRQNFLRVRREQQFCLKVAKNGFGDAHDS